MGNRKAQENELLSVEAIFGDMVHLESSSHLKVKFSGDVQLSIYLPDDYPSSSPPQYELSGSFLNKDQKKAIRQSFREIYLAQGGEPVLYEWINFLNGCLMNGDHTFKVDSVEESDNPPSISTEPTVNVRSVPPKVPEVISGNPLCDRKSTFQAHVARISSRAEVGLVLSKLKENNKIARATHNIYAWVLEEKINGRLIKQHDCEVVNHILSTACFYQNRVFRGVPVFKGNIPLFIRIKRNLFHKRLVPEIIHHVWDSERSVRSMLADDGEIGAGPKLLNLLELMKAKNVMVIVTRWYGGIHLGADRFKHICNLARIILVENGFSNKS